MSSSTEHQEFAEDFVSFMNEAATAFHATEACALRLKAAGFTQLSERDSWTDALQPGGKYFFIRNDTSVMAFSVGRAFSAQSGAYTVLGAHTDSPCLRVKPVACVLKGDALLLNTQPYGGGLWHTWFDRDLGLAGRVVYTDTHTQEMRTKLFRIDAPIARIPTLAIHLTSGAEREGFAPNLHEHGKALLSMKSEFVRAAASEEESDVARRIHPALLRMIAAETGVPSASIEDVEMQLIDVQPATIGGSSREFIYSGRLDNLCSTYQCLRALIDACDETKSEGEREERNVKMVMLFDHEEIGSNSTCGAASSMFMDTIQRIQESLGDASSSSLMRVLRNSFVVSADMAHGLHPNYSSKHDASMAPVINGGMVIKHNANQRYATNAISATLFRKIGKAAKVPVQEFTVRADSACGSTIGPIIATLSGILTVDCGTPQFSMHSIREMMGAEDALHGYKHLKATLELHPKLSASLDSMKV